MGGNGNDSAYCSYIYFLLCHMGLTQRVPSCILLHIITYSPSQLPPLPFPFSSLPSRLRCVTQVLCWHFLICQIILTPPLLYPSHAVSLKFIPTASQLRYPSLSMIIESDSKLWDCKIQMQNPTSAIAISTWLAPKKSRVKEDIARCNEWCLILYLDFKLGS